MSDPNDELYAALHQRSLTRHNKTATPADIEEACETIRGCIRRGANLGVINHRSFYVPLWSAISNQYPIEIIQVLYDACKDSVNIKVNLQIFSRQETRVFECLPYTIEHQLADTWGQLMRDMSRCTVDDINYIEGVLNILQIKEEDIDWDLTLKIGYLD
jgi:hypothetical protein